MCILPKDIFLSITIAVSLVEGTLTSLEGNAACFIYSDAVVKPYILSCLLYVIARLRCSTNHCKISEHVQI